MTIYVGIQARMVELLATGGLSAPTIAVVAELIARNAAFDLWGGLVKKKESTAEELLELVERIDEWEDQCRVAAAAYAADGDEEKLRRALISVGAAIRSTMSASSKSVDSP